METTRVCVANKTRVRAWSWEGDAEDMLRASQPPKLSVCVGCGGVRRLRRRRWRGLSLPWKQSSSPRATHPPTSHAPGSPAPCPRSLTPSTS
eukprot:3675873-Rhodomonas_salina.1